MTKARLILALPALLLLTAVVAASCGGGDGSDKPCEAPCTITIWHSMPSLAEGVIERMADEFNASQSQYKVELIFQGSYAESLNKLIASIGSGDVPAAIQLADVSTQIMVDSQEVTPVQDFVDAEDFDLSDFEPKAIDYYTLDGKLYAMPFNLSGPLLYYDRQAFEDAGLDPDQPPRTLEELRAASEALVARPNAPANAKALSIEVSAWFFEEMLAKSGALYVNNDNGRDGRATEAMFDGTEGKEIFQWWDEMVADGLAYNAPDTTDAMLKLASGETSMAIASTAALRGAIAALAIFGRDPSQYDAAAMPGPEGEGGGIALGGAAFWVLERPSDDVQRGAWEFLKFASGTEQQARWHADTGYFPSRISSLDEPVAVQTREEFPQFEVALDQLHDSPDTTATAGALVGPFSEVRDVLSQALEQVLAGAKDPDSALEDAADQATGIIEEYNRTAP